MKPLRAMDIMAKGLIGINRTTITSIKAIFWVEFAGTILSDAWIMDKNTRINHLHYGKMMYNMLMNSIITEAKWSDI